MNEKLAELDRKIIALISERSRLFMDEIGERTGEGEGHFSPVEKAEIEELIKNCNEGPLPSELLMKVYNELVSGAIAASRPVRVAYFGPAGTYTHLALLELFGESAAAFQPIPVTGRFASRSCGLPVGCGRGEVESFWNSS